MGLEVIKGKQEIINQLILKTELQIEHTTLGFPNTVHALQCQKCVSSH